MPSVTGELQIASREDFHDFERQLRALKRSRVAAPLSAALLLAAVAVTAWRWSDVYAFLAEHAPRVTSALPASFRPSDLYDGVEHEPNDSPAQANPLPIPPGPDGRRAGGVARMHGHIGAKISDTTGDVDVYRIEIPPLPSRSILVAEWAGDVDGEGIRGLDVALTLNRERTGGDGRSSAPLVANVDRGGTGRPEALSAAVGAGTYYLAVRERHRGDAPPVEKPTDRYGLAVRLAEPRPGDEIEPNDAPEGVETREVRYPQWRALAERTRSATGPSCTRRPPARTRTPTRSRPAAPRRSRSSWWPCRRRTWRSRRSSGSRTRRISAPGSPRTASASRGRPRRGPARCSS
jgi:hypothetical protein